MTSRLRLRTLGGGRPGHYRARVFDHWTTVAARVCDRLLSRPEHDAWAVHLERLRPLTGDVAARRAFAQEVWETEGVAAEALYREWVELVGRGARRGYRLGWWWVAGDENAYFTPEGALVSLVDGHVRDVVLPGPGIPWLASVVGDDVEGAIAARRKDPLPADRGGDRAVGATTPFTVFRRAAREVKALYLLRALQHGAAIQSPRFECRLDVVDAEALEARVLSSEGPR